MYAMWSKYIDRHGARPTPSYQWSDTISPTLGARYSIGHIGLLADVSYVPTPVPFQTGRTNYVDNDRVSTSVGGEDGFDAFGSTMHVGLQLQPHFMVPRHQYKIPTPTNASGKNLAPELVTDELPDDAVLAGNPVPGAKGLQTNNPG